MSAVLIDKGCVVNSLYHYPTNMVFFTTPELLEIGDIPMTSLNEKPVRAEALKYYRRVADHYKLDIRQYETVSTASPATTAPSSYARDRPTGCRAVLSREEGHPRHGLLRYPEPARTVPGEDLPKVIHYYKEAAPLLRSRRAGHRREELGRDRGAGAVVDRRARHADPSRPGHSRQREVLDQAEHRESHQERRDPGLFQLAGHGDPPGLDRSPDARGTSRRSRMISCSR